MRGRTLRLSMAVLVAALAVALAVLITGCGGSSGTTTSASPTAQASASSATGEPYKIGAVLSLTGTYAGLGTAEKKSIDLEVARINDAGGVNGRPLDVLIEDDATDEAKAVAAATKLIEQDKVIAILGASGTGQTMAMRGDVDRAGIPQISMAGGTVVTGDFDSLVYQTPWSNTIVVPFVLKAIEKAGYTKIAVISDTGGYGTDGLAVIKADAPKYGLTIVADETFNPGDTDMSAQLTKIKGTKAQAVLLWTAGKEGAIILTNARDLGLDLPFYGGSGQARMEFVAGAGTAAEGFVFGTGKSLIPANWGKGTEEYKVVSDFAKRFEAAYGEPPDIFAGHAFDAVNLTADALARAGANADSATLQAALEKTKGVVGFGGIFTFSPTNHNGLTEKDLALYKVQGGKWVTVK
jgi:branched-chain amino acid transport system substrate-binding protein